MNRTIPITRASRFAINLLHGVQSGSVHSVYRKTINLHLQPADSDICADAGTGAPRLIALQDRDCVLSPLSLCTALSAEQLSALPIEKGQTVLADAGSIRIVTPKGMIEFELPADDSSRTSAARKDPNPASPAVQSPAANPISGLQSAPSSVMDQMPASHPAPPAAAVPNPAPSSVINLDLASHPALPLPEDRLSALSVNINHALPLSPPGSFARIFCDPAYNKDLILDTAGNCISKAAVLLQSGDASSAAETLCKGLIGLGSGLTPSGDDFLCGVLAGLYLRGAFAVPDSHALLPAFARSLRNVIPKHLSDTIDISAAFLRCACEEQFSEAIAELAADPPDLSRSTTYRHKIARRFSKIGHSSGFDTLAGISFVLRLTSDAASVP